MSRVVVILAVLMFAASLAGCGQKGPLKLPADLPPAAAKTIAPEAAK